VVLAGVAGEADVFLAQAGRLHHAVDGEVVQGIEADELGDVLLQAFLRGDEFTLRGKVDPVGAGEPRRRAAHGHVEFLDAAFPETADAVAARRAADDGIRDGGVKQMNDLLFARHLPKSLRNDAPDQPAAPCDCCIERQHRQSPGSFACSEDHDLRPELELCRGIDQELDRLP